MPFRGFKMSISSFEDEEEEFNLDSLEYSCDISNTCPQDNSHFETYIINRSENVIVRKIFFEFLDFSSMKTSMLVSKSWYLCIKHHILANKTIRKIKRNQLEARWLQASPNTKFINFKKKVTAVYSDDMEIICCLEDGHITIVDLDNLEVKVTLRPLDGYNQRVAFNKILLATGFFNKNVKFWDRHDNYKFICSIDLPDDIFDIRIAENKLAVSFNSGIITVYNVIKGTLITMEEIFKITGPIRSVNTIEADKNKLVCSHYKENMLIYSLEDGSQVNSIAMSKMRLVALAWPLAILNHRHEGIRTFQLWNVQTMTNLCYFDIGVLKMYAIQMNLQRIIVCTNAGNFYVRITEDIKNTTKEPQKVEIQRTYGALASPAILNQKIAINETSMIYPDMGGYVVRINNYLCGDLNEGLASDNEFKNYVYKVEEEVSESRFENYFWSFLNTIGNFVLPHRRPLA
jgi:WD40 repeat protein